MGDFMKSIIFETTLFIFGLTFMVIYGRYSVSQVLMCCMWFLTFFYFRKIMYFLILMFFNSEILRNSEKKELILIKKEIKRRYDCDIIQSGLRVKTDRFDFSMCECTYLESFTRKDRTKGSKEYVLVEPLSSIFKKLKNKYTIFLSPIGINRPITLKMQENNYCAAIKSSEIFIYVTYCILMFCITLILGGVFA